MTTEEAIGAINAAIAAHPELTDFGFGVFDTKEKTPEQREEEFARDRHAMFEPRSVVQFIAACDWLGKQKKIKALCRLGTSYGLKHVAAHDIGYVTNGMFIAAAHASGFRVERLRGSPNALFNISKTAFTHGRPPK